MSADPVPEEGRGDRPTRPRTITVAAVLFAVGSVPWLVFTALGTVSIGSLAPVLFVMMIWLGVSAYVGLLGIRLLASVLVPLSCVLLAVPLVASLWSLTVGVSGLAIALLVPGVTISLAGMVGALVGLRLLYVPASATYLAAMKARRAAIVAKRGRQRSG